MNNKKGFTLVELLAVIVVLAIIALIGYSTVGDVITGAQESANKESVREYAKSVELAKYEALARGENPKFTTEWLKNNIKMSGSQVECDSVKDVNGSIELSGCTVNDSSTRYCYYGEPVVCSTTTLVKIYGNSVQNGTPSPTNPVEIQSVGDKTENLFDVNDFMETYQPYVTFPIVFTTFEGEEVLRMYGAVNATGRAVQYLKGEFKEKTAYTFSLDCYDVFSATNGLYGVHFRIYYTDSTSTYVEFVGTNRVDQAWKHHSYTSNPSKTVAYVALSYATGGAYSYFKNIQIKEGGAETQYEPYGKYKIPITVSNGSESKTTNIYLDEPLRKIGDYADTLDLEKGAVVRRVGKRVLNVSDKWGLPGTLIDGYSSYRLVGFFPTTEALPFLSNYFKTIPGVYYNLYKENLATSFPNSNQLIINISNDLANSNSQTTVENWKTWLNGKNVYVLYPLIETTAETVSVPEIPELSGSVTYSIGTSVQPSSYNYDYK